MNSGSSNDDYNVNSGHSDFKNAYLNAHHDYSTYDHDKNIKEDDTNTQHAHADYQNGN